MRYNDSERLPRRCRTRLMIEPLCPLSFMETIEMEIIAQVFAIFPILMMVAYLAVLIYLISLASRFVKAMERIADKFGSATSSVETQSAPRI